MKKSTFYPLGVIVAIICLMTSEMSIGVNKGRGGSSCLVNDVKVENLLTSDDISSSVLGVVHGVL